MADGIPLIGTVATGVDVVSTLRLGDAPDEIAGPFLVWAASPDSGSGARFEIAGLFSDVVRVVESASATGQSIPVVVSREWAIEIARSAGHLSPTAKVDGAERQTWTQARSAASGLLLQGEEPVADRPAWLVTLVTVGEGPASTGGELSQVLVDGLDGRVIAVAQVFS